MELTYTKTLYMLIPNLILTTLLKLYSMYQFLLPYSCTSLCFTILRSEMIIHVKNGFGPIHVFILDITLLSWFKKTCMQ